MKPLKSKQTTLMLVKMNLLMAFISSDTGEKKSRINIEIFLKDQKGSKLIIHIM